MHIEALNLKAPPSAYPDDGNGPYGRELPYKSWLELNRCTDSHNDFMQTIAPTSVMLLIASINLTEAALGIMFLSIIFRVTFGIGYCYCGSDFRRVG